MEEDGRIERLRRQTSKEFDREWPASARVRHAVMGRFPMLVGQYTNYLKKQTDAYRKGERPHDERGSIGVLGALRDQDIQDVLAYLTSIQTPER
ncbi:hypothetical protein BURK2_03214 [Burkholderiales bacterium]|nr:hypothetical protein BURK2_03214 [Burkholderiales bacterium]